MTVNLDALLANPDLVESIPQCDLQTIVSAFCSHAAAVQARLAAVQSRLAARMTKVASASESTDDDRLITAGEFAAKTKYRMQYVYKLVRDGRLLARREGRKIRIRWGDAKAYIRGTGENSVAPESSSTHSNPNDRRRDALAPYPSRIRGPRGRRSVLDSSAGTTPGTDGSSDPADSQKRDS